MACRDMSDLARIAQWLGCKPGGHPHWAVVTDRSHRVRRIRGAATLNLLADRLAKTRLDERCFAIITTESRGSDEESVVADWRMKRMAERNDSCFFAWMVDDEAARREAQASAAA